MTPLPPDERKDLLIDIGSVADATRFAEMSVGGPASSAVGVQYGTAFSNALAVLFANKLRPLLPGVLPNPDGSGGESRAASVKGYKRLDVNYSTPELGLALGVSIKTINVEDGKKKSAVYSHNYSRIDSELRAEAMDYHLRQPYSVLVGILFLPAPRAWEDWYEAPGGRLNPSSFGKAVTYYRDSRAPRHDPGDAPEKFERFFVGLHGEGIDGGKDAVYYDVMQAAKPPGRRQPTPHSGHEVLDTDGVVAEIMRTFRARNPGPANEGDYDWAE